MNYEKFIIDSIQKMSGGFPPYQIFSDWIALSALSISNSCKVIHDDIFKERESKYCEIAAKYSKEDIKNFADMTGALALILEDKFADVLGDIYMKSGCGSKMTGQFFTPYHLSYLTAKLTYDDVFKDDELIEVSEPSTGGGGMMIAICQIAKENGFNYQRKLRITAQDLDWNGVFMTYIQLSLLGARAIVVQGDTLCDPYRDGYDQRRVFRTPAELGVIL